MTKLYPRRKPVLKCNVMYVMYKDTIGINDNRNKYAVGISLLEF